MIRVSKALYDKITEQKPETKKERIWMMYSEKKTISMRQTYRLFVFDFLGISTLILPQFLAGETGVYGGISILTAWALGTVYLCYLVWCRKRMGTDLVTFLSRPAKQQPGQEILVSGQSKKMSDSFQLLYGRRERMFAQTEQLSNQTRQIPGFTKRFLGLLLVVLHTAAAGFTGAVTAGMVRQSLIREESYALVLLLVFLAAAYAIAGDVTDRARVYEVLFWFVTVPLVVMLVVAAKEIDLSYYKPQTSADAVSIVRSTYAVFGCFGVMSAVLFLPVESKTTREKTPGEERKLRRTVWSAFTTAIVILLIAYYVMIGTFGEKALSVLPYPVITLMSMIQFKGGFLKRLDAIMLAVWFFTLFALLSLNLYYGSLLLRGAIAPDNKKNRRTGADAEQRRMTSENRGTTTKPTGVVGENRGTATKSTGVVGENRGTATKPTGITGAHITVLAASFLAGLVIGNREDARQQFISFFLYIQLPLHLLLPGVFATMAESPRGGTKKERE
jgi:hypothetical protein